MKQAPIITNSTPQSKGYIPPELLYSLPFYIALSTQKESKNEYLKDISLAYLETFYVLNNKKYSFKSIYRIFSVIIMQCNDYLSHDEVDSYHKKISTVVYSHIPSIRISIARREKKRMARESVILFCILICVSLLLFFYQKYFGVLLLFVIGGNCIPIIVLYRSSLRYQSFFDFLDHLTGYDI